MYVCVCVHTCVCVHMCIYIYIHTCVYIHLQCVLLGKFGFFVFGFGNFFYTFGYDSDFRKINCVSSLGAFTVSRGLFEIHDKLDIPNNQFFCSKPSSCDLPLHWVRAGAYRLSLLAMYVTS